jgi:hypothetical protein
MIAGEPESFLSEIFAATKKEAWRVHIDDNVYHIMRNVMQLQITLWMTQILFHKMGRLRGILALSM